MSPLRRLGWVGFLAVFALTGCTTARIVSSDSSGGIVAIPENSNHWPHYYRDQAIAVIKQDCPNGYAIAKEGEVITGTVTTDSNVDAATHKTETHNSTEFRLYYVRAKPVQLAVPAPRSVPVARVTGPTSVGSPAGLPPAPIAVPQ